MDALIASCLYQVAVLEGGRTAIDFATVAAQRELSANLPAVQFTVENTGCLPLELNLAVRRTGRR